MQFNKETFLSKNAAIIALSIALILVFAIALCAVFGSDRDGRLPGKGLWGKDRASMRGAPLYRGGEEENVDGIRPSRGYNSMNTEVDDTATNTPVDMVAGEGPVAPPPPSAPVPQP